MTWRKPSRIAERGSVEAATVRFEEAARFRRMRAKKKAEKAEMKLLTPEELTERLALTAEEFEEVKAAAIEGKRNAATAMGYLAKVLEYRAKKVDGGGDGMQVNVVVRTLAKPEYEVPAGTSVSLPGVVEVKE